MSTLSFEDQLKEWAELTKGQVLAVFHGSVTELVEVLDQTVPVETGFLRSTRTVVLNGPFVPANKPRPEGLAPNSVPIPSGYQARIRTAKLGDFITVSYAAEYAPQLEYGTSKRAPRAWVRGAGSRWPQIVATQASMKKAIGAKQR